MKVNFKLVATDILESFKDHKNLIQTTPTYTDDALQFKFESLCGDMSYKCFYRVSTPEGRFILVVIPTQGDASIELFNSKNQLSIGPAETFINTANELALHLQNVSPVHAQDMEHGLILLSDHGSCLFEDYVNTHRTDTQLLHAYFGKIFHWLKQFQELPKKLSSNFFALQRAFEKEAIYEELEEFIEFGLIGHEKQSLTINDRNNLEKEYQNLALEISKQPHALIHRDFQSKNIMLEEDRFWVIDYQDLCYGPYTYDYASIIFDPYLNLSLDFQLQLVRLSWEMNFQDEVSYDQYLKDIKLCAEQRLLKAAGRYAKHRCLKSKNTHMKYYQPALNKVSEFK